MTKKDEDRKAKRKQKRDTKEKEVKNLEWNFNPVLGYVIEPQLTLEDFEIILARLSVPSQDANGQGKKET